MQPRVAGSFLLGSPSSLVEAIPSYNLVSVLFDFEGTCNPD